MARRKSRKPAALVLRKKSRRHRRARKAGMMRMVRNPGMALSGLADMQVAGLPVLPVAGFSLLAYGLYDADDMMERLSRPTVLVGGAAGGLAAWKYGKGLMQQASFVALGLGAGLLVDRLMGE